MAENVETPQEGYSDYEVKCFQERKALSYSNMLYSVQRIDLLVIAISGAGIYVCFETFKYMKTVSKDVGYCLKTALFLLLISIIVNFLSQMFGKTANEHDYLMCLEGEEHNKTGANFHDRKSAIWSKAVNISNMTSVITMFCGLSLLVVYFSIIF